MGSNEARTLLEKAAANMRSGETDTSRPVPTKGEDGALGAGSNECSVPQELK